MKKIAAVLLGAALALGVAGHADAAKPAHKHRTVVVHKGHAKPMKRHLRLTAPLADGRLMVVWNDGTAAMVKPCQIEDQERCFWNAGEFGNGRGHSFIRMFKTTYYLNGHVEK